MGKPSKIDVDLLITMIEIDGKTASECARFFNVPPAAISKVLKILDATVKRHVAESIVMGEILSGFQQRGWL